jgi:hypothetical protein
MRNILLLLSLALVACGPSPKKKSTWEDLGSSGQPSLSPEEQENQRRSWERSCRGRPGGFINSAGVCIYTSGQIILKTEEEKKKDRMEVVELGNVHLGAAIYAVNNVEKTTGKAIIQVEDKTIGQTPMPLTSLPAGRLRVVFLGGTYEEFGLWVYQCYTQLDGPVTCPLFPTNPAP